MQLGMVGLGRMGANMVRRLMGGGHECVVQDVSVDAVLSLVKEGASGRWTIAAANDEGVPAHVLTASLFERFASRDLDLFQNKVLSAMRFGFGGHVEKVEMK